MADCSEVALVTNASESACPGSDNSDSDKCSNSSSSSVGGGSSAMLTHAVSFDEIVEAANSSSKKHSEGFSLERMEHALAFSRLSTVNTKNKAAPARNATIGPIQSVFPLGCESLDALDGSVKADSPKSSQSMSEHHQPASEKHSRTFHSLRSTKTAWDGPTNQLDAQNDDCVEETVRRKHDIILAWEFCEGEKKKPVCRALSLDDITSLNSTSSYLFAAILLVLEKEKKKKKKREKKRKSAPEKKNSHETRVAVNTDEQKAVEKKPEKALSTMNSGEELESSCGAEESVRVGSVSASTSDSKGNRIPRKKKQSRGMDDSSIIDGDDGASGSSMERRARRASFSEMERFNPQTSFSWSEEIESCVTPRGRTMPFVCLPRVSDAEIRRTAQNEGSSRKAQFSANKQQRESLEHLFSKPVVRTGDVDLFSKKKRASSTSSTSGEETIDQKQVNRVLLSETQPKKPKHGVSDVVIELFLWNGISCSKDIYMAAFAKAQLLDETLSMPSSAIASVSWICENKRIHQRLFKDTSDSSRIQPSSLAAAIRNTLLDSVKNKPGTSLSLKTAVLTVVRDRPVKHHKRRPPSDPTVGIKQEGPRMWSNAMAPAKPEGSKRKHHRKEKKDSVEMVPEGPSGSEMCSDGASEPNQPVRFHIPVVERSGVQPGLIRNFSVIDFPSTIADSPTADEARAREGSAHCSPGAQEAADSNHRQVASDRGKVSPRNTSICKSPFSPSSGDENLAESPAKPKKMPPPLMLGRKNETTDGSLLGSETVCTSRRPASLGKLSLDKVKSDSSDSKPSGLSASAKPRMSLNLGNARIQIDDAVPENDGECEGGSRYYRGVVSEIEPGLYLTGEEGASNYDELKKCGITFIVNAADRVCQEHFPGKFRYLSLDLLDDGGKEDLRPLMLFVIDIVERNRAAGGATLLHCHQGISRSATLAIAYVMWKRHISFRNALDYVTKKRPVVSPNGGFMGQLLLWESLLRSVWNAAKCPHLLRMSALESSRHEMIIVGKEIGVSSRSSLDSRGCFVYHDPSVGVAYTWVGERSTAEYRDAAVTFVDQLQRYLCVQSTPKVFQGFETAKFWSALGDTPGIVTTVSAFDREYNQLEPNAIYRFTAWDRVDVRTARLLEEAKCQAWGYYHRPQDSSEPKAADESGDRGKVRAKGEAFFWIPKNFVVRLENECETRNPDEVFALISSGFIRAGGFPSDTICRKVSDAAEILDLKFPPVKQPAAKEPSTVRTKNSKGKKSKKVTKDKA